MFNTIDDVFEMLTTDVYKTFFQAFGIKVVAAEDSVAVILPADERFPNAEVYFEAIYDEDADCFFVRKEEIEKEKLPSITSVAEFKSAPQVAEHMTLAVLKYLKEIGKEVTTIKA